MQRCRTLIVPSLAVLALGACASRPSPATSGGPSIQTTRVQVGQNTTAITTVTEAQLGVAQLPAPLPLVWSSLRTAYDSLGIPLTKIDETNHVLGNEGMKVRRRLGKAALTRLLDCGSAQAGPNAETYEVHISVLTLLTPSGPDQTRSTTKVEASARPVSFAGDFVRCTSTGQLERSLESMLRFLIAR